jgi:predicted aspartyl protease
MGQQLSAHLQQIGQDVPAPIAGVALIDSGASGTCVDEDVAAQLGLPVIDVIRVASATDDSAERNVYSLQFTIVGLGVTMHASRATGAPLAVQGIQLLVGRDLLQHCIFVYNGLTGSYTLSI